VLPAGSGGPETTARGRSRMEARLGAMVQRRSLG
jgi:hypothetical protein